MLSVTGLADFRATLCFILTSDHKCVQGVSISRITNMRECQVMAIDRVQYVSIDRQYNKHI